MYEPSQNGKYFLLHHPFSKVLPPLIASGNHQVEIVVVIKTADEKVSKIKVASNKFRAQFFKTLRQIFHFKHFSCKNYRILNFLNFFRAKFERFRQKIANFSSKFYDATLNWELLHRLIL